MRELVSNIGVDYLAFAITAVIVLLFSLIYLFWSERRPAGKLSFPGLEPTDERLGNLGECSKDGGLHEFLLKNHKKFGPMFSFWWGQELCVSMASPTVWKDVLTLFDRPNNQYKLLEPLIGPSSLQYINGDLGRKFRRHQDRYFSVEKIRNYESSLIQVADELRKKWSTIGEGEHVHVHEHMIVVALKSIIRTLFGEAYFKTNKEILEFGNDYEKCWDELETRLDGDFPEKGSEREKAFEAGVKRMRQKAMEVIEHRRSLKVKSSDTFLDAMLDEENLYSSDQIVLDMTLVYLIGGFHTTGNVLAWAIYYLCKHPEVTQKVYAEICGTLGDAAATVDSMEKLTYTRQVIDETLRCSVLAPYAARFSDFDIIVGGHLIPKKTPMVLALGCVLQDPEIWPEPQCFNPDRFSPENQKTRHPLAFSPFGFAGKRKCPGFRLAYYEAALFLTTIVKNFDMKLVPGPEPGKRYGLVTRPKEDIFITIRKRNQKDKFADGH